MAKGKNQHFVPKCYLKHFSNSKGFVNVFLLAESQLIKNVPYSSQCQLDYYYGRELIWENLLGKLETACAPIFKNIIELEDYYPDTNELAILRQFVIFQHSRTTVYNNLADKQRFQLAEITARIGLEHKKIPYTEEQLTNAINGYFGESDKISRSSLSLANDAKDKIDDLGFILVRCSKMLITSDNPIILINPFTPNNIGFSNIGLLVFFPIGLSTLALFYDKKLFPSLRNKEWISCNNEDDINTLNAYQYVFGNKVLIGSTSDPFEDFLIPKAEYREWRDAVQKHDPAIALGDKEHRLIVVSPPSILLDHSLSFCPLLSDARKIPIVCREPIPRIKEDGYLEKIRLKSNLYPFLINKRERSINNIKPKEYQRGIQRMEYLANKYWK